MNMHLLAGLVLVLSVTVAVFLFGWEASNHWAESRAARLADPEPTFDERASLPRAGYLPLERVASYGPWPIDTGPLPLLSELSATWDVIERQQRGWP